MRRPLHLENKLRSRLPRCLSAQVSLEIWKAVHGLVPETFEGATPRDLRKETASSVPT